MAQFYQPKRGPAKAKTTLQNCEVIALDHQGRGVVRAGQQVFFVAGALAGERVDLHYQKPPQAQLIKRHNSAKCRVAPPCTFAQQCGGCDLQHLELAAQREHKHATVTGLLGKFAGLSELPWQPMLSGAASGIRARTRLAVRWLARQQRLAIGFRAAQSKDIVEISHCLLMTPELQRAFSYLPQLSRFELAKSLGHIELLQGDPVVVMLRLTQPLTQADQLGLTQWLAQLPAGTLQLWLHDHEQQRYAIAPVAAEPHRMTVSYPSTTWREGSWQPVAVPYRPGDFYQANVSLNAALVQQACEWLQPTPNERVLELFAGTGNFTQALLGLGAQVTAVEGDAHMTRQLQANNSQAGERLTALTADLSQPEGLVQLMSASGASAMLLDPARAGAREVAQALAALARRAHHKKPAPAIERILYVSCAPDTFARDAQILTSAGYQLVKLGLIDMFPHTHHIETMALFEMATLNR